MAIGNITVILETHPKWWFRSAIVIAAIALRLGLIRDADSAEHWGGRITGEERVAKWIADFAFKIEVC